VISRQLLELAVRRERLQARADMQRATVADDLARLAAPLETVDRAIHGVRWLRGHPLILVASIAVLGVLRPRSLMSLVSVGLRIWAAKRALSAPQGRVAWALLPRFVDFYQRWRSR
jgi:hypothetical protein